MTIYKYKNNTNEYGHFSRQHFIIEDGVVYKLNGTDSYIIGSYNIDISLLEVYKN